MDDSGAASESDDGESSESDDRDQPNYFIKGDQFHLLPENVK